MWCILLAKNEDVETRKPDSRRLVPTDAVSGTSKMRLNGKAFPISLWKQHLILAKGKRNWSDDAREVTPWLPGPSFVV